MKKIIALILAVIMMFSITSVSYATDTTVGAETSTTTTIDNYMDYLETKLEGENFFVQLIARLVIIGVMLGFIKIEDFEVWFDNTAPDTDAGTDSDKPTEDNNTNSDWEDGTELSIHPNQTLPYIMDNNVTITYANVTKDHCDILDEEMRINNYKYNIEIKGENSNHCKGDCRLILSMFLENGPFSFALTDSKGTYTFNDDGSFTYKGYYYTAYDSNRFTIDCDYYHSEDC